MAGKKNGKRGTARPQPRTVALGELDTALRPCANELLEQVKIDADKEASRRPGVKRLPPSHGAATFHYYEENRIPSLPTLESLIAGTRGFIRWQGTSRNKHIPDPGREPATRLLMAFTEKVAQTDSYAIREEAWQTWLEKFQRLLNDGTRMAQYWVPILGIVESPTMEMGDTVLRPLSGSDSQFLESMNSVPWRTQNDIAMVAEITRELAFHESPDDTFRPIADALLHALRLHSGCHVLPLCHRFSCDFGTIASWTGVAGTRAFGPKSALQPDFADYWYQYRATLTSPSKRLTVALHRFTQMHESPRNDERILDQLILLEALLGDEGHGELLRKIRQRTAHFMADDFETRKTISRTMGVAYDARSKIAHGKSLEQKHRDVQPEVDELVPKALARYVHLASKDKSFCNTLTVKLDDAALGQALSWDEA